MPLDQAGPTHPTDTATCAPPMHAKRDTRHWTHRTRTYTKNSRTKTPRSTNTSVSGRMLLSSEFQLTKNSHRSQSEARNSYTSTRPDTARSPTDSRPNSTEQAGRMNGGANSAQHPARNPSGGATGGAGTNPRYGGDGRRPTLTPLNPAKRKAVGNPRGSRGSKVPSHPPTAQTAKSQGTRPYGDSEF